MRRLLLPLLALALIRPAAAEAVGPDPADVRAVVDKAHEFLKSRQKPDGSFEPARGGPGTTALIAVALVRLGKPADDPVLAKALGFLEKSVQKDGGVYNRFLANYTTSIAVLAFKEANQGGKYDKLIENATRFLKGLQHGGPDQDLPFGGFGYDGKSRPDTSNSHFSVEALLATLPKDDPSVKNALIFLSRCQNLPGEANKLEYAKKATENDRGGGFRGGAGVCVKGRMGHKR
ncbi:MAG TPA: prenyltransferase/squalene oxidase repeat-containing protein, partial [Gemmataceae bacterium]|nr:prenyltransferase/squalene oxidase repeat-containing protein [Gemmataceae bacterium]